jgi:hypothetical protein
MLFAFATQLFGRAGSLRKQSALVLAGSLAVIITASAGNAQSDDAADLIANPTIGSMRQVRAVVEVEGQLKVNADGQKVQHVPLKAKAELQYVERLLEAPESDGSWRAVRSYQAARADIRLRDAELTQELRDSRRLIVVDAQGQPTSFSPLGPITREELELVEAPASRVQLESLLPGRRVKCGETWTLADAQIANLLGLDAVSQQDVRLALDSIEDDLAIVSLAGKIAGAIGGVSSDIELKGKLNFDLKKRMVTWLTLALRENRAIGHAQPGFDVVTKLRLVVGPSQAVAELGDASLAGLPLSAAPGQTLIDLTSESGGFQIALDRRWGVMFERHDLSVLRFVDRGDLIAQCNVSPRPALGKDERLTIEGFQDEVKQALGKSFGQVVETSEERIDAGIRVLRVVVSGSTGELPIQWTYYLLSDDQGHRAALVFTIETNLVERFPQIDRELIASFRFLEGREPKPAPPAAKTARRP